MMKWFAGAAALALIASPAAVAQSKGNGNAANRGGPAAQVNRGGGNGNRDVGNRGGPPPQATRGNGNGSAKSNGDGNRAGNSCASGGRYGINIDVNFALPLRSSANTWSPGR